MTRQTFTCRSCRAVLGTIRPSGDLEITGAALSVEPAGRGWLIVCGARHPVNGSICACPMAWDGGMAIHWRKPEREVA